MIRFCFIAAATLTLAFAATPASAQLDSAAQPALSAQAMSRLYAQAVDPDRFSSLMCPRQVLQSFPTSGPPVTTWRVCWHEVADRNSLADPNGLVIGPVDYQLTPNGPWRRLIADMRISDFFVPYHPGLPRYYDLSYYDFRLSDIPPEACPATAGGTLLTRHVCKEVHDRGLMFLDENGAKRSEELVLWGVIWAGNYRYIERFSFHDDGVIVGEEGATGQNLPGSELVPHVHNALWRIDLDVFDPVNNAMHGQHVENINGAAATDVMPVIGGATGLQYDVRTHDSIMVTNTGYLNARGHHPAYVLMPLVTGGGLTQHHEDFTQNDFWVTPYDPHQFAASQLALYVAGHPSVLHNDLVVWYKGSLHHHPRDEDGAYDRGRIWHGTTHAMFAGFMLMPHDVFDCSPFYFICP
ncbi:MAG: hypothetical protein M3169_08325 [Candidatus Eremiobacteraeota bacterium]|nr:hypothetical protein [Candidatus Eremiobacteraeota bacterium]